MILTGLEVGLKLVQESKAMAYLSPASTESPIRDCAQHPLYSPVLIPPPSILGRQMKGPL